MPLSFEYCEWNIKSGTQCNHLTAIYRSLQSETDFVSTSVFVTEFAESAVLCTDRVWIVGDLFMLALLVMPMLIGYTNCSIVQD